MISFFVGVPGSGKTYYAVDKIYNNFSTDKEAKKDKHVYDICYTNINEFEFEKVSNVLLLDFDNLKSKLTKLHKLYKEKNTDDVLIEFCKENNIYNCYFVIDEAHNFFSAKDSVLIWWLSYHRHLYHEIILITQNISLIEAKYKSFSEFFYRAVPTSLNLFKSHFKYNQYCDSRMSLKSKTSTFKLKKNQKVFELYHSGDSIKASNIILKFLVFALVLTIVLVIYFYFVVLDKSVPEPAPTVPVAAVAPVRVENKTVPIVKTQNVINTDYSEKQFLIFRCSLQNCINSDISIPYPLFQKFISSKDIKVLFKNSLSKNYFEYFCESSIVFYSFLSQNIKGSNDETINFGSPSPFANPLSSK